MQEASQLPDVMGDREMWGSWGSSVLSSSGTCSLGEGIRSAPLCVSSDVIAESGKAMYVLMGAWTVRKTCEPKKLVCVTLAGNGIENCLAGSPCRLNARS